MTIGEIVGRIRATIKETTSDSYISNRHIWSSVRTAALMYIKRDRRFYSSNVFTTETRNPEPVDIYEDTCVPLSCISCRVDLSDVIEDGSGIVYQYITTIDGSKEFKIVTPKQFQIKSKKTKGRELYAYYENEALYFSQCFDCIKISYLKDSLKNSEANSSCGIMDEESFIPDYLLEPSIKTAIQELSITKQIPEDTSTNKSSNS